MYRIFDRCFQSTFPLPELARHDGGTPEFAIQLGEEGRFDRSGFVQSFEWRDEHDRQVCRCERRDKEYLFVFPHHAAYHLSSSGLITCLKEAGSSDVMMRHLLLNQVIPRYLASTGSLVLHASALTLPAGDSVAFIGRSGHGKSTLASAFHREGAELISDDCILLDPSSDPVLAVGGLHGIRLLPDAKQALFADTGSFSRYSPYSEKQQLTFKEKPDDGSSRSCKLDALYLLNDPLREPSGQVQFTDVAATQAVIVLMHCAFSLDPGDAQARESIFDHSSNILNQGLPVFELAFPRRLEELPELVNAISAHVRQAADR